MRRNGRLYLSLLPALALALLMSPAAALAFHGHPGKGFGPHGGVCQMILNHRADLDLTDAQVKQLEALQSNQRESLKAQFESLRADKRALRDLLAADEIDRAEADRRIDSLTEQMAKLHRARMSAMLDAQEILTAEQRTKLRELHRAMRDAYRAGREEAPAQP
jgi:Spy/CpxP family protein refolding chaperone